MYKLLSPYDHVDNISSPTSRHGKSFHFLLSSSTISSLFYNFHCGGFFTFLIKVIAFILVFEDFMNGIVFLILFSESLSLSRKATDF
jgi:hypothetical protein